MGTLAEDLRRRGWQPDADGRLRRDASVNSPVVDLAVDANYLSLLERELGANELPLRLTYADGGAASLRWMRNAVIASGFGLALGPGTAIVAIRWLRHRRRLVRAR